MSTPNKKMKENLLIIDDLDYKFLLDIDGEHGEDYRSFVSDILTTRVIKKKFILLAGLENKINRLNTLDGALDSLAESIKENINCYTPEQTLEFYQTLSGVYNNDVLQLKRLFIELLKHVKRRNETDSD